MGFEFDLLYLDDHLVVIDKPEGFHVHRPELPGVRVDDSVVVLQQLRDQIGKKLFPIHRLDAPTSGCLVMALSSEVAAKVSKQFETKDFQKTYQGVARGWTPETLCIDMPLESADKSKSLAAISNLKRLATIELNHAVGIRHPTARYSLVELEPVTGRFHQLRRHLNRISHPLVGDVMHGDRHHNHFFTKNLLIRGLCLRATSLRILHPVLDKNIHLTAPLNDKWKRIQELFFTSR